MPASHVAVYYYTASTLMWGKTVADTDAEIAAIQAHYATDPNTSVLLLPRNQPYDDATCIAAIAAHTGKVAPSPRCAVHATPDALNNEAVVDIILADPSMIDPARLQNPGARV